MLVQNPEGQSGNSQNQGTQTTLNTKEVTRLYTEIKEANPEWESTIDDFSAEIQTPQGMSDLASLYEVDPQEMASKVFVPEKKKDTGQTSGQPSSEDRPTSKRVSYTSQQFPEKSGVYIADLKKNKVYDLRGNVIPISNGPMDLGSEIMLQAQREIDSMPFSGTKTVAGYQAELEAEAPFSTYSISRQGIQAAWREEAELEETEDGGKALPAVTSKGEIIVDPGSPTFISILQAEKEKGNQTYQRRVQEGGEEVLKWYSFKPGDEPPQFRDMVSLPVERPTTSAHPFSYSNNYKSPFTSLMEWIGVSSPIEKEAEWGPALLPARAFHTTEEKDDDTLISGILRNTPKEERDALEQELRSMPRSALESKAKEYGLTDTTPYQEDMQASINMFVSTFVSDGRTVFGEYAEDLDQYYRDKRAEIIELTGGNEVAADAVVSGIRSGKLVRAIEENEELMPLIIAEYDRRHTPEYLEELEARRAGRQPGMERSGSISGGVPDPIENFKMGITMYDVAYDILAGLPKESTRHLSNNDMNEMATYIYNRDREEKVERMAASDMEDQGLPSPTVAMDKVATAIEEAMGANGGESLTLEKYNAVIDDILKDNTYLEKTAISMEYPYGVKPTREYMDSWTNAYATSSQAVAHESNIQSDMEAVLKLTTNQWIPSQIVQAARRGRSLHSVIGYDYSRSQQNLAGVLSIATDPAMWLFHTVSTGAAAKVGKAAISSKGMAVVENRIAAIVGEGIMDSSWRKTVQQGMLQGLKSTEQILTKMVKESVAKGGRELTMREIHNLALQITKSRVAAVARTASTITGGSVNLGMFEASLNAIEQYNDGNSWDDWSWSNFLSHGLGKGIVLGSSLGVLGIMGTDLRYMATRGSKTLIGQASKWTGMYAAEFALEGAAFAGIGAAFSGEKVTKESLEDSYAFLAGLKIVGGVKKLNKYIDARYAQANGFSKSKIGKGPFALNLTNQELKLIGFKSNREVVDALTGEHAAVIAEHIFGSKDLPQATVDRIAMTVGLSPKAKFYTIETMEVKRAGDRWILESKGRDGRVIEVEEFFSREEADAVVQKWKDIYEPMKMYEDMERLTPEAYQEFLTKISPTPEEVVELRNAIYTPARLRTRDQSDLVLFAELKMRELTSVEENLVKEFEEPKPIENPAEIARDPVVEVRVKQEGETFTVESLNAKGEVTDRVENFTTTQEAESIASGIRAGLKGVDVQPDLPQKAVKKILDSVSKVFSNSYLGKLGQAPEKGAFEQAEFIEPGMDDAVKTLASILGVRAIGVRATGEAWDLFNGIRDKEGNILVNIASENPVMAVIGHEWFHTLEQKNPELATSLKSVIENSLDAEAYRKARFGEPTLVKMQTKWQVRMVDDAGKVLNKIDFKTKEEAEVALAEKQVSQFDFQDMISETTADFVGTRFMDRKFWKSVYEQSPEVMRSFIKYIDGVISALKSKSKADPSKYINDLENVRNTVDSMLKDFLQGNDSTRKLETGDIKFSVKGGKEKERTILDEPRSKYNDKEWAAIEEQHAKWTEKDPDNTGIIPTPKRDKKGKIKMKGKAIEFQPVQYGIMDGAAEKHPIGSEYNEYNSEGKIVATHKIKGWADRSKAIGEEMYIRGIEALKDPTIRSGQGWYHEFRRDINKKLGRFGDFFAQMLGATSARNKVTPNVASAWDAITSAQEGRFDEIVAKYGEHVDKIEGMNRKQLEAEAKVQGLKINPFPSKEKIIDSIVRNTKGKDVKVALRADLEKRHLSTIIEQAREMGVNLGDPDQVIKNKLINTYEGLPRKKNNALYGINSKPVLRVLYGNWAAMVQGAKTPNFWRNLIGTSTKATIDMWAARFMHSILYERPGERWRITPTSETGVNDNRQVTKDNYSDYHLSEEAMQYAADKLRMTADDFQAMMWFAEKIKWDAKGWQKLDLGDFREELKKPQYGTRREFIGLTTAMGWGEKGPSYKEDPELGFDGQMYQRGLDELKGEISNVSGMVSSTVGKTYGYVFEGEPSYDIEYVRSEKSDPTPIRRKAVELAREAGQESMFFSSILNDDASTNGRPVLEIHLREPGKMTDPSNPMPGKKYSTENMAIPKDILDVIENAEARTIKIGDKEAPMSGFTLNVDGDKVIGLRLQFTPEYIQTKDGTPLIRTEADLLSAAEQWARHGADIRSQFMGVDKFGKPAEVTDRYLYFRGNFVESEVLHSSEYSAYLGETKDPLNETKEQISGSSVLDRVQRYNALRGYPSAEGDGKSAATAEPSKPGYSRAVPDRPATRIQDHIREAGIKFQVIGEAAGNRLGYEVEDNLVVAREMEKSGQDRDQIYRATGWERGADGLWRMDLIDPDASFRPWSVVRKDFDAGKTTHTLSDLYYSESLYKAHPELADLKVEIESGWDSYSARYVSGDKTIYVGANRGNVGQERYELLLQHEVQHAIQDVSGFGQGGNIKEFGMERYGRISGEVESRNVEARAGMTPEARRSKPLSSTEDVSREDQITLRIIDGKFDLNYFNGVIGRTQPTETGRTARDLTGVSYIRGGGVTKKSDAGYIAKGTRTIVDPETNSITVYPKALQKDFTAREAEKHLDTIADFAVDMMESSSKPVTIDLSTRKGAGPFSIEVPVGSTREEIFSMVGDLVDGRLPAARSGQKPSYIDPTGRLVTGQATGGARRGFIAIEDGALKIPMEPSAEQYDTMRRMKRPDGTLVVDVVADGDPSRMTFDPKVPSIRVEDEIRILYREGRASGIGNSELAFQVKLTPKDLQVGEKYNLTYEQAEKLKSATLRHRRADLLAGEITTERLGNIFLENYPGFTRTHDPESAKGFIDAMFGELDISDPDGMKKARAIADQAGKAIEVQGKRKAIRKQSREFIFHYIGQLAKSNLYSNYFVDRLEVATRKVGQEFGLKGKVIREVMPFLIEGTEPPKELNRPDLENLYKDIMYTRGEAPESKQVLKLVDMVRDMYSSAWEAMVEAKPSMADKEITDYVNRIWDFTKADKWEAESKVGNLPVVKPALEWAVNTMRPIFESTSRKAARFETVSDFMKKRYISSIQEGMTLFGLKPKTLDIGELISAYNSANGRAIQNAKFIDSLKSLYLAEKPELALIMPADIAPGNYKVFEHPALTGMKVHRDLLVPLKAMMGSGLDFSGLNSINALNGLSKKVQLSVSLFHHLALTETGMALSNLGPLGTMWMLYKSFTGVRNLGEAFKAEGYSSMTPAFRNLELTSDAVEHALQLGASSDYPAQQIQKIFDSNPLTKYTIGKFNQVWDTMLWDRLHDGLKLFSYEAEVGKILRRNPSITPEELRKKKIEAATFINDTFGGQQFQSMVVGPGSFLSDPKFQQILGLSLLSKDWTVSTIRQGLSVLGIGQVYSKVDRAKMGGKFVLRAAAYVMAPMAAYNAYNRLKDEDENPEYTHRVVINGRENVIRKIDGQLQTLVPQFEGSTRLIPANLRRHKDNSKPIGEKYSYQFQDPNTKEWHDVDKTIGQVSLNQSLPWGNTPGKQTQIFMDRDEFGRPIYARFFKQFREVPEFILDEDGFGLLRTASKKLAGKTSPFARGASVVLTGGYEPGSFSYGRHEYFRDVQGGEYAVAVAKYVSDQFVPFSFKKFLDPEKAKNWQPINMAVPTSVGYSYPQALRDTKEVIMDYMETSGDGRTVAELDRLYYAIWEAGMNPMQLMDDGLTSIKRDESKASYLEVDRTIESIQAVLDADKETPTLSNTQRDRYTKKIKSLEKEQEELWKATERLEDFKKKLRQYAVDSGVPEPTSFPDPTPQEVAKVQGILKENEELDFVQRILHPENYGSIAISKGMTATHLMSYAEGDGRFYVYPEVVNDNGTLRVLDEDKREAWDYAMETGEYITFDTEEEAAWFSGRYKVVWPASTWPR